MRLKGKFYRSVARPTGPYDLECWVVDRRIEQSTSVAETRMLRRMSGVTRDDRIRNEYVRSSVGLASIVDKSQMSGKEIRNYY